jgi:hypothetical protein
MSISNAVIKHVLPTGLSRSYPVNVKVPDDYIKLIDQNLKSGALLAEKGFKGRAEVVRYAVFEFLVRNGIHPSLDPKDMKRER